MRKKNETKKVQFPTDYPIPDIAIFFNFLWKKGRDDPDVPQKLAPSPFSK